MEDEAPPPVTPSTFTENPFGGDAEAVDAIKAADELAEEPSSARFFGGKKGAGPLLATTLQDAVEEVLTLARGPGRILYLYENGMWKQGGNDATKRLVRDLLGEQFRKTHAELILEAIILTTPHEITDAARPDFINFTNGMLQWRTGELFPHAPEYLSTNQIPFDWNPDAVCPRTDRFMMEVLHTDAAWIG